jgi:hypothetical protein
MAGPSTPSNEEEAQEVVDSKYNQLCIAVTTELDIAAEASLDNIALDFVGK